MKMLRAIRDGWVTHAPYAIYEMCFDIYTDGVVRYSEEVEDYDESGEMKRRTRRRRWKMPQDVFERLTYLLSYGIYDIGADWDDEHYWWNLETYDEKGKKMARHSGAVEEDWEKVLNTLVDTANAKLKPIQLKAILLNRWGHWCGGWGDESDRKGFMDFYLNDYMQGPRRKKHRKANDGSAVCE